MLSIEEKQHIMEYLNHNLKKNGTIIDDVRTLLDDKSARKMLVDIGTSMMIGMLSGAAAPVTENRQGLPKKLSGDEQKKSRMVSWMEDQKREQESLADVLERKLVEKGYKDRYPDFYKKIDMDRRLFSKILSKANSHRTDKKTIFKFLVGLESNLEEAQEILEAGGYTFHNYDQYDLIIKYCIENGIYTTMTVDEYLELFDEKPLFSQ